MNFREAAGLVGKKYALMILADRMTVKDLSDLTFEQCKRLYQDDEIKSVRAKQLLAARIRELSPEVHPAKIAELKIRLTRNQLRTSLKKFAAEAKTLDDWFELYDVSEGTSYRAMVERKIIEFAKRGRGHPLNRIYELSKPGSRIERIAEDILLKTAKYPEARIQNLKMSRPDGRLRRETLRMVLEETTGPGEWRAYRFLPDDSDFAEVKKRALREIAIHGKSWYLLVSVYEEVRDNEAEFPDEMFQDMLQRMHDSKKSEAHQRDCERMISRCGYAVQEIDGKNLVVRASQPAALAAAAAT